MSKCLPRIIENDYDDEKYELPVNTVIVYLPALIKSACYLPGYGYGPTPITPFYAWTFILIYGGKHCGKSVGIPIPKFTLAPFITYLAALLIIFIRISFYCFDTFYLFATFEFDNRYIFF